MSKTEDTRLVETYLSGSEWQGRAGASANADESLLVSPVAPILADYVSGGQSTAKKSKPRTDRSQFPDIYEGTEAIEKSLSPERVNLGAELQLDTSLCPSLGLGGSFESSDSISAAGGETEKISPNGGRSVIVAERMTGLSESGLPLDTVEEGAGDTVTDGLSPIGTKSSLHQVANQVGRERGESISMQEAGKEVHKREHIKGAEKTDLLLCQAMKGGCEGEDVAMRDEVGHVKEEQEEKWTCNPIAPPVNPEEDQIGTQLQAGDAVVGDAVEGTSNPELSSSTIPDAPCPSETALAKGENAYFNTESESDQPCAKTKSGTVEYEVETSSLVGALQQKTLQMSGDFKERSNSELSGLGVEVDEYERRGSSTMAAPVSQITSGRDSVKDVDKKYDEIESRSPVNASPASASTVPMQKGKDNSSASAISNNADAEISFLPIGKCSKETDRKELSPIAVDKNDGFDHVQALDIRCDFDGSNAAVSPEANRVFETKQRDLLHTMGLRNRPMDPIVGQAADTQEDTSPAKRGDTCKEFVSELPGQQDTNIEECCVLGPAPNDETGDQGEETQEPLAKEEPNIHCVLPEIQRPADDPEVLRSDSSSASANDRMSSPEGMQTHKDLSSTKKKLGANSRALLERLRGAAEKRKMLVAQSRDSLAAKEQQQLFALSSVSTLSGSESSNMEDGNERWRDKDPVTSTVKQRQISGVDPYKPFKARPVPATTGDFGHGGQVGIPKVAKKPPTTPMSPKLGIHRQAEAKGNGNVAGASHVHQSTKLRQTHRRRESNRPYPACTPCTPVERKQLPPGEDPYVPFKARPLPVTTGDSGHGGQTGVPRVSKRPSTMPTSPCLGVKGDFKGSRNSQPGGSKSAQSKQRLSQPIKPPPKKSTPLVKDSAMKAKPFKRLASGSEASRAKEMTRNKRMEQEEAEMRRRSMFKARPLPASVVEKPRTNNSPGLVGLKVLEKCSKSSRTRVFGKEENADPNQASPYGSPMKRQRRSSLAPPTLHSTEQADRRAAFEKARSSNEQSQRLRLKKEREDLIQKKHEKLDKLRRSLH